jgi:hypothetical protein
VRALPEMTRSRVLFTEGILDALPNLGYVKVRNLLLQRQPTEGCQPITWCRSAAATHQDERRPERGMRVLGIAAVVH